MKLMGNLESKGDDMGSIIQTILIVDDARFNVQIITDILADDYHILSASSGQEALDIAMSQSVDLILLDIIMPGMDGYEVCHRLKNDPHTKNIPIIFVTAMTEVKDETKGLEMGAIDYIFKPVNPAIVKVRVKNHLELKKYRDMLEKQSLLDGLTGIANRRHFDEVFNREWRRALRMNDMVAIVFLDIDFFKKYNDCYGHLAGDDCLRQVGITLKNSLQRAGDFVARYGGEEFVVILPGTSLQDAALVGEKIRGNIEGMKVQHTMSEVSDYVTVSVGVNAVRPTLTMTAASLIAAADSALYHAKRQGRNRVVAF